MKTVTEIKSLFIDDVEARKKAIRDFIMDKSNSYEDRLEIYLATPEHLRHGEDWVFHHPYFKDDDWCDYDCWNRNQDVDLTDIPEYVEWGEDEEKVKQWYTGCMDEGVWFFNFDW